MSLPVGVVVAVRGSDESRVVAELDAHPRITVVRRCADLAEAVAVARAGLGTVVVVSDQPHLDADTVAGLRAAGVALVGVGPGSSPRLAALGLPVVEEGLADAVLAATPRAAPVFAPPRDTGGGAIIAVWGTGGAPGRTTVAVNLAAEAALAGHRTVLVDLDTYGASVASALGLADEAPGIAAVARAAARGEDAAAALERHLLDVAPRLRVLTGLTRAARWPEVTAGGLARLWPALRCAADVVVVDVAASADAGAETSLPAGPRRDVATLEALAEADALIVVGGAEPHQLVRLVQALLDHEGPAPVVAVNRIRASVAGPRPEDAIAAALGRHAGVSEVWPLPWDPRACDIAAREGRVLAESAPRAPLRGAIASMSAVVVGAVRASRLTPAAVPD
ncbi:AAA family ATPase [Demequina gelatinilytica]|uniref:AAA family ATPase n=1 Tax=Demequina gelatinilytica TaxID=1638980 RepID=UPI00078199EA|nr:P-loop NTPase [Demequina gelatinilytica]